MLVLRGFSVGDACFCQFLLMMLASGFDAGSAGVFLLVKLISTGDDGSAGDVRFCQFLLMMLASGCDADSAGDFCW